MPLYVTKIDEGSPAQKLGLSLGCALLAVDGHPLNDALDYQFYTTPAAFSLDVCENEQHRTIQVQKGEYEPLGCNFKTYLGDEKHSCSNHCMFCFIDQLPPGMRAPLYFKDDDERLSFLFGNYITLTNLTDHEIDRIIQMHISPIFVSVHTTNPELRVRMLANKRGGEVLKYLPKLADTRRVKQAAIVHDWENKWALEGSCGPRNCGLGYWKELACHYNALARHGITVDFVNQESDLTGYGLVIVPMQYLLRNKFAQALCDYTAQGGTVVVTYWTGVVDESDLCYLGDTPYGLTDLLGLRREEIDALYDGETCHCAATDDGAMEADGSILCEVAALNDTDPATPLMLYAEDYYAGCPAAAVHAFGKGQAYYLASRFNADFYNDFYAQVCEKAGLQPAWPEQLPAGVLATRRGDFVFMQNCNDHSVDIDGVELEKYSTRLVQLEPVDEDDEG